MLKSNVIEPAQTEWASTVLFAPEKDGKLRFCIEYRRLNALKVRNSYPIPLMDECINSLGDAKLLTTFDCISGDWQVEVEELDSVHFPPRHVSLQANAVRFEECPGTFQMQ